MTETDGPHRLLALQERDTEADQLRHRRAHLPERKRLDEVVAELATVERDGAEATVRRDALARRQHELDAELSDVERRLRDVDARMRSGAVTASRELQAMAEQIESLKRRRSTLEDADLEVMEEIEPVEAEVLAFQDRWATLDREASELRTVVAALEASVNQELAAALAARQEAAEAVAPDLLKTYERLRQRMGGVGAAPLVGASCGGCHLTLSAGEVDRIRHAPPDEVITCPQCGRILVRD